MIDDEIPKHIRKKGKKKFVIECRYPPAQWDKMQSWLIIWRKNNDWRVYRKYEKEADRDKAFRQLNKNTNHGGKYPNLYEYRIPE